MITYVLGDLFRSPARVLVNTVNTVGVMGKGIAKDFKAIYPEMFKEYQKLCENGLIDIGRLHLFRGTHKWILNFPTKKHWRQPSTPEYIEAGLKAFVERYSKHGITTIAFPQLGCGHGELDWEAQVKPLMEKYLSPLPIEVFIYLYRKETEDAEHNRIQDIKKWLRAEPESLAFSEVWDDLGDLLSRRNDYISLEKKISFQVNNTMEPAEGLYVYFQNKECLFIPRDAILDAWQHLRSVGFLTQESFTQGLDCYADEIMTILSQLPYLKIVEIASRKDLKNRNFRIALQLIPRSADVSERASASQQVTI